MISKHVLIAFHKMQRGQRWAYPGGGTPNIYTLTDYACSVLKQTYIIEKSMEIFKLYKFNLSIKYLIDYCPPYPEVTESICRVPSTTFFHRLCIFYSFTSVRFNKIWFWQVLVYRWYYSYYRETYNFITQQLNPEYYFYIYILKNQEYFIIHIYKQFSIRFFLKDNDLILI